MQLIVRTSIKKWGNVGKLVTAKAVSTVCPHCAQKVVFNVGKFKEDELRLTVGGTGACPDCDQGVRFWSVQEKSGAGTDGEMPAVFMYPSVKNYYPSPEFSLDIPEPLNRSFISTIDAFNSQNYVATAVCSRRTLEGIFKYLLPKTEKDVNLVRLIEKVKTERDLAAPLTALSHAIRGGGNLGAHFDAEKEPDEFLARQMVELLEYLISYLYILPKQIEELEKNLDNAVDKSSSPMG